MIKRFVYALLALLFCGGPAQADTATTGKLSIWLGYPETVEAFKLGEAEFKKQYPNVQVEILTFELREFEAKLAIAVPTGAGPDILALHDFLFQRYYEAAAYDDVPADITATVNDAKIIDAVFKDVVTRGGKVWGLPWWTGRSALYYNLDHFKEAGIAGPPETVAQMWQYAEKLTRKGPNGEVTRAGISMRLTGPSGGTQKFGYVYFQTVGRQMLEPGKKPGTVRVTLKDNLDVAARTLMEHINHLHGDKKSDDWALKHDAQGFASGAAAMFLRESWVIPFVKKNGPDVKFGVSRMPKDKAWGAFNFIEILSVNKTSKMKKAAWDFVRILQDQKILNNVLESSGWVPLRKDRDFSELLAREPRYAPIITAVQGYTQYLEPPNTAYEEVTTRMGEVIQTAYRDASLVNNLEGVKKVILRVHETAVKILKDQGIYAE
ncbi:MAG: extracellular solute-binding protein [Candidatus Rokubacteria bacterium]|nr:extracellular solute-binding protein [Candidatus Rokubacteria bacterium]